MNTKIYPLSKEVITYSQLQSRQISIVGIVLLIIFFLSPSKIFANTITITDKGKSAVTPKPTQKKQSWAEKLGFPSGKKVLLLHIDDVGMCPEANTSTYN